MIRPLHYSIRIDPDLQAFTFAGVTRLEIQATDPLHEVVLNAHELEFQNCTLEYNHKEKNCDFTLLTNSQEAIIHFPETIAGNFILTITYIGSINHQYAGLYRSKYVHNGQEKYLISTQFEAKDARRAFPCFDQPGDKATFDIEYVMDASLTGISNTQVIEERILENGKRLVRFARTPRMSTYLVFLGIGEFEFLEDDSEEPLVRVATTQGKTEFGRFALDMARKSLRFGGQYTGIPYPLAKCDLIAIPDSLGAMENFGALRHSEDDLLVYPGMTSQTRSVLTAKIIAHECIHMWFGDLVSPAAWKYLWLNEAFATYFTYVIPHYFYPEWGVWEQFFPERMLTGLERDSLSRSVPIDLPNVDDPDADPAPTPSSAPIVYNKGAAVICMLATYLGENRFKQGINHYLTQYQFESASSHQFWAAIEKSTGEPIGRFAETWIHQPGYPLIDSERDGSTLHLTQTRFAYDLLPAAGTTWVIPVSIFFLLEDGTTQTTQLLLNETSASVPIPRNLRTYKLNAGFTGFYRVRYSRYDWEQLGKLIQNQTLSSIDSLNVVNDFFTLVKVGVYSIDDYLRYVESYLAHEARYLPLLDVARNLSHLYRAVKTHRAEISCLGNTIFEQALEAIGYQPDEDESLLVTELRASLLTSACLLGSSRVSEFGMVKFQSILNGQPVHRVILSPVLKIGAATHPAAQAWLSTRAASPSLPEGERAMALEALGNLVEAGALQEALRLNMEKTPVSLGKTMLAEAALNPSAFEWMWAWYMEHLTQIEELPLPHVQTITVSMASLSGIGHYQAVESCLHDLVSRFPNMADSLTMALEYLAVNERLSHSK
jgi:aminopeptidase N